MPVDSAQARRVNAKGIAATARIVLAGHQPLDGGMRFAYPPNSVLRATGGSLGGISSAVVGGHELAGGQTVAVTLSRLQLLGVELAQLGQQSGPVLGCLRGR